MSNLRKGTRAAIKVAAVLTAVTTMLSLSGVMYLAPNWANAAAPADYGLKEGDTISAAGSDDPDVYIVNEQGYKRLFLNPAIFGLYGHLGGFAAVKSVSPATRDAFPTSGLFRVDGDEKVYGLETTGEDTAALRWVNTSGAQAVADDPNFFKKVFIINAAEKALYATGADYTSVNQVPAYTRGGSVPVSGPMSATLASDNPVAGTVLETQALADIAHFQVNGSGLVTSMELKRLGISGDTTVSDVYLFVNGVRVSDAGNISSGMINFSNGNGLFTAPANVSVRATIADAMSGQTLGVQLTKVNTSVVSVSGNLFNIAANPATLATLSVGSATGPGNFDPQVDVNVWQANFTISNEDVYFRRVTVREIGSVNNSDITNLRLFVDGTQIASDPDLDADGYATFLMNYRVLTGNRVVKVVADVVGGSSRTMSFSLRGYYDLDIADESYNVAIKASNTFPVTAAESTIGSASVSVIKAADSPAGDMVDDSSDVVLGRFTLTAYGESIKIETLAFRASVSNDTIDSLRNGRVMINGTQYGSTATLATTGDLTDASSSYTVNYTLQPGVPATVEVRADLHEAIGDTDSVTAEDIISLLLDGGSDNNNAQGITSAATVDVPGTTVESNNQTVKAGSMTVAKYTAYANQNVVTPNSALKLGHYILTGGSSEDVNINTINVGFDAGDAWTAAVLSNVSVKILNSSGGLVVQTSPKSTVTSTASNSYSVNFTLPKSTSYHAEVWGTVSSFTVAGGNDTMNTQMSTSGTSAQSGASVTGTTAYGQTLTAASGSVVSAVGGAMPASKIVVANSTSNASALDFTATNDNFTLYELHFTVANAAAAATIANVIVKDGSSVITSAPLNGLAADFTGLNVMLPNNDTKTLTIDLQYGNVGVGGASTAANAQLTLASFKARDSVGTITNNSTPRVSNNLYVHKSYPVVAAAALPSSVLIPGEISMSKFNLSAVGNTVGIAQIIWDISKSTDTVLASVSSSGKLYVDGNDVTSQGAFTSASIGNGQTSGTVTFIFANEYQVGGGTSKLFELKDTVSSIGTTGSLVTQWKGNTSSAAAPNASSSFSSAKLVWTDRSALSHTESTADWMNDNLIKDSTSQALSK